MKRIGIVTRIAVSVLFAVSLCVVVLTFFWPSTASVQHGYRGTGMDLVYHRSSLANTAAANTLPDAIDPVQNTGTKASAVYKNVQVLGNLDQAEFIRLMSSITAWVAPTQGCTYCHSADGNFASDALYTKKVARRMLQMTRHINADWQNHVGKVGVVCYTCHRGNPVPSYVWFTEPTSSQAEALPSAAAGDSALPTDPFGPYLEKAADIRVQATTALPEGDRQSIKQTEWTYALMMHMSQSLGVNCTYCHNTQAFGNWSESTPQRVTAWYGIRLVRDLNTQYMGSLQNVFPPVRLGPFGDVAKINCLTCHQGVFKPLYGASLVSTYPELTETKDVASAAPAPEPAPPAAAPAPVPTPPAPAVGQPPSAAQPPAGTTTSPSPAKP